jgi:hypothetical protein
MPRSTPITKARRRPKRRRWRKPKLSLAQILAWADEHQRLTGQWPTRKSGRVRGSLEEDWNNLDNNLRQGDRGLLPGDSLARLLWRARGVRNPADPPPLTEEQILAWADKHYQRHGAWPIAGSGCVSSEPEENWKALDMSLRAGSRGLPGGSSLARLLARERNVPNEQDLPRLTLRQILSWADQYHEQTGNWPTDASEPLPAMNGARWPAIDAALRAGNRGLPGGDSLPQLLARERGMRNVQALPQLTIKQILAWADDLQRRTGAWPAKDGGAVLAEPSENWRSVDNGLRLGLRGLPGGESLAKLMSRRRGVRNRKALPRYTVKQILRWADAYHAKHGKWPTGGSGPVKQAPGETWTAVDVALRNGIRGLPGGDSLARLLARHGKKRNRSELPALKARQVLAWADAHFARTDFWPHENSGPIAEAPGETWSAVNQALKQGHRGLPGGDSLARLLDRRRRSKRALASSRR